MMGMRVALMLALAGVWLAGGLPVRGQSIMNANRAAAMAPLVEHAQPGEQALRCDVAALKPTLNYSFRFQSGYTVSVPMNQYLWQGSKTSHQIFQSERIKNSNFFFSNLRLFLFQEKTFFLQ